MPTNPDRPKGQPDKEDRRVCSCGIEVAKASMCTERDGPWRR